MEELGWIDQVCWNDQGLVPVIAQDAGSGEVLMLAWMNRDALRSTVSEGRAVYWSRSRGKLWRKGESSGNEQIVRAVRLDCDSDALLIEVEQQGVACHTGRRRCFHHKLEERGWRTVEPVLHDPETLYGHAGAGPEDEQR